MRALIGPDLLRKLPEENIDIRDSKLTGFVVRCRASGAHSYLVQLGRGRLATIGRLSELAPEQARLTAESMLSSVSKNTLTLMADDPALTLRDAKARARGAMRGPRGNRRRTWRQFLDDHYAPWVIANRKTGSQTVALLRSRFAEFDAFRLDELSGFAIERWRSTRLKAGAKPATVNRNFAALRAALSMAVEWKVIKAHPMAGVKQSKVDKTEYLRYLDDAEETRLRAALAARDDRRRQERDSANRWRCERGYDEWPALGTYTDTLTPLVLTAINTGLRFGELTALRWCDLDFMLALVTVRSETAKTGRSRRVPLNAEVFKVLAVWKVATAQPAEYVFPGIEGARLTDIKTAWMALLKAAKITDFRFHDTRHHFASRLVMAGVDLNTTRELLGHADIKMTLRYAHLAPEHTAAAVAKLVRA